METKLMTTSLMQKLLSSAPGLSSQDSPKIFQDIVTCQKNVIDVYLRPSPLVFSEWLSSLVGGRVWLKLESLQPNGSFKVRGALNALSHLKESLKPKEKLRVCAASAGNHAQGVALAAKRLGGEAHIFLSEYAPLVKQEATKRLGAHVYLRGKNLEEATEAASKFSTEQNIPYVHAYNNYDIIVGQATCVYECYLQLQINLKEASPAVDFWVVSLGGGGLAAGAGILAHTLNLGEVIGVEQESYDSAYRSLKAHERLPREQSTKATLADGIAVNMIGNLNFDYLEHFVPKISLVNDNAIVCAILGLCEHEHLVVEGAGAAAVAEVMQNKHLYTGKTTVVCVSGGNIDPQIFTRILTRGLHETGRVLNVRVCVRDRPGGLKALLEKVAQMGGNVLDLVHDRTYSEVSIGDVDVELSLETRNEEHKQDLLRALEEADFRPRYRM
jgi:threonine dehydratase